ncbi:MAG: dTDP-glucose 4,6-dehydratase [Alphaproteobacteria bacterium]|nr:dTDP-glucose 4,6-dehydratase [Alphaproteobacteria bacterium]
MVATIIVTGGAGFIGSCFVANAVEKGYHVVVLDALTYAGHRENIEWIQPSSAGGSSELVVGDICDRVFVSNLLNEHQPSAIVNFAAESHVDNSISKPSAFVDTNIIGCYTLLEAAREYWNNLDNEKREAFRFVQISTDEVYGSLGETGKFSETTAMKPNSPYSATKAAGDHLARAWYKTYGLPTIVTNCTNNYGPRQFPEKLIPHMIRRALEGKSLPIYGDGKNIRDWIHVEDHNAGVMLALEKGTPGQTYCFGGNAEKNNNDVVKTICSILDELQPRPNGQKYEALIAFVPDRPGHDRRYAIDDTKAQDTLGFTRKYNFEQGIRATIQWYLDNQHWCEAVTQKKGVA